MQLLNLEIFCRSYSPARDIYSYALRWTHLVSKVPKFARVITRCFAHVDFGSRSVLAATLIFEAPPCIVCLVLIIFLYGNFRPGLFWQAKSRKVEFGWWIRCSFRHISAWANRSWCRSDIFESFWATAISKRVLWFIYKFWLFLNEVLGAWVRIIMGSSKARLCAKLRRTYTGSPLIICIDWVVEEECILIKIKLRFLLRHFDFLSKHVLLRLF